MAVHDRTRLTDAVAKGSITFVVEPFEYQYLNRIADDEINSAKNSFNTNIGDFEDSIITLIKELVDYVNEENPIIILHKNIPVRNRL